jgi:hypothetical protein
MRTTRSYVRKGNGFTELSYVGVVKHVGQQLTTQVFVTVTKNKSLLTSSRMSLTANKSCLLSNKLSYHFTNDMFVAT